MLFGLALNFLPPLAGVAVYLWLCTRMTWAGVRSPPYLPLFILFFNYGGLMMVLLTVLFWEWSGMASIGFFYLVLVAPITMLGVAIAVYYRRSLSWYHRVAFVLSIIYCCLTALLMAFWIGGFLSRSG
jgi:hypothetical protein